MRKYLIMTVLALIVSAIFCQYTEAQNKTKRELRAEAREQARIADSLAQAERDSLAKLDASIVDGVEMTFKFTDHNFGNVEAGSDVSYEFEFINTGKGDLVITNVSSSCGCTTPNWSREPIQSKKRGKITVKYDSNRIGSFSKTITVYSNAKNSPIVLSIKGTVMSKNN